MEKNNEQGAVVIEATISLTAFVFALFTILLTVNIAYIQGKIGIALNSAAREISQYSYMYYKLGVNNWEADLHEQTEESHDTAKETIDGMGDLMNSFSDIQTSMETSDFDAMIDAINNGGATIDSLATMYADKLSEDPKGFIIGMGKMAGEELKEEAKVLLGQILAKAFMRKNLMAYSGDDPNQFLKRYRVVDGMDGMDFNYSSLMTYGTTNQIQLVVTYDVSVIKLLNVDFKFTFRQCAKTTAWGKGISLINPDSSTYTYLSVWDNPSAIQRGRIIVSQEKNSYEYTSGGNGFDAYNDGQNEFISITSMNTHDQSYKTEQGIIQKLNSEYSKLYNGVGNLGEEITVTNQKGETVTLKSDPNTRSYKIVLVIPEDSDMEMVKHAVASFEAKYGASVEIKPGYGSPSPVEPEKEDK